MQFIHQIYSRLCKLLSKKKKTELIDNEDIEINKPMFSIDMDKKYNKKISVYIPEEIELENVIYLADAYSSSIIDMEDSKMARDMFMALEESIDKRNPMQKLLLDNIVYAYIYRSQAKADTNSPIVKPREVFRR